MAIGDSEYEKLVFEVLVKLGQAEKDIAGLTKVISGIATAFKVSFDEVGTIVKTFVPDMAKQIDGITASLNRQADATRRLADEKARAQASSPYTTTPVGQADIQKQVDVSLNQTVAKELSARAITQDNLNRADAQSLALQERLVGGLSARAIAEQNVALAQKNIVASNLADADAQMLKQLNTLVPQINAAAGAEDKRALASRRVAEAEQYQTQTNASEKIALATRKIADAERGLIDTTVPLTDAQKKLGAELKAQETQVKKTTGAFSSMINVVKGAITAMLTLAALRAVTKFFSSAIKAATEFRGKLAELNFAEAILSKKGMDISLADFDELIDHVVEKVKYLSTLEVTGIVAEVANMSAEFNIAQKDIEGLTEAIAFMQLSQAAFGQEIADGGSILNAAADGRSNFFNRYGINITKAAIKEKTYAMGLVETGSAIDKASSNTAAFALLIEQTANKFPELLNAIEKVNPALANQMRVTKELKEAQLDIGNAALEVKDAWNSLLSVLIKSGDFQVLTDSVIVLIGALAGFITLLTDGKKAYDNLGEAAKTASGGVGEFGSAFSKWFGPITSFLTLLQLIFLGFTTIVGAIVTAMGAAGEFLAFATGAKTYEEAGTAIGNHFANGLLAGIAVGLAPLVSGKDDPIANSLRKTMELLNGAAFPALPDTPQGLPEGEGIDEEAQKMKEALDKLNEDILQAELKLKQDMQDVAIDLGRKMVDITLEYETKRAELAIDYANKIADINRNYAQKLEDIDIAQHESHEQSRQDELERERAFQEKMLQLKEEFLMDLDDALHSRDARAILKLIKRYNLDKLQAEREHAMAEQAAKEEERIKQESFERQRKEAQEARDRALEDARIDYERKLEELARQEQAEVEAAVLAANRKLADLEKENLDRNILIAAGLANDFATTATWLGMIDQLFTDHYGYVTGVYGAMMSMLSQPITMGSVSQSQGQLPPAGMIGGTENPGMGGYQTPTSDSSSASLMLSRGLGFDKGLSSLKQNGKDRSSMFASMQGGGNGADGKVSIELLLSPDLESRIVKNTLSKTAEVVTRVGKSKG